MKLERRKEMVRELLWLVETNPEAEIIIDENTHDFEGGIVVYHPDENPQDYVLEEERDKYLEDFADYTIKAILI